MVLNYIVYMCRILFTILRVDEAPLPRYRYRKDKDPGVADLGVIGTRAERNKRMIRGNVILFLLDA